MFSQWILLENLISAYYRPHEFIVLQERAFVNEVLGTQLVLD